MIIIPKEKPVLENLNIYYLNVKKLLEHYQGELGSGGVFFSSHTAEGAIFFDKDDLLNGFFESSEEKLTGPDAIERILDTGGKFNFSVSVHSIGEEEVYFWASIPSAERLYSDLSTEFTDFERLILKLRSEKLTGYIDISLNSGDEGGLIFLLNGNIIGGSYSWGSPELNYTGENQKILIRKTNEFGATFNVSRIPLAKMKVELPPDNVALAGITDNVLPMLEEFLAIFENVVRRNKKGRLDFNKLLKKKFVENADRFNFLDPFAGEFEYTQHQIHYSGDTSKDDLVYGVIDSVKELALELGIRPKLNKKLGIWRDKYSRELDEYSVNL